MIISPEWKERPRSESVFKAALARGLSPLAARVVAGRFTDPDLVSGLTADLSVLDDPATLPDVDKAAERILRAVANGEQIGLATDHDADGITSCAVLTEALTDYFRHPRDKIGYYIAHRLNEGYGLTDSVADRILAANPRPSLIITADKGSSNEPQIARLKAAGIDVVVTDHHEMPEVDGVPTPPASAYAVVSPKVPGCAYPDPYIAGCMVAWLTMAHARRKGIATGQLPTTLRNLGPLLEFVAVGTVADCVSLARSKNNRAVVRAGLEGINAGRRPAWQIVQQQLGRGGPVRTETLAFAVCPRLAASGRLAEAAPGIHFLLARELSDAEPLFAQLDEENQSRKAIERSMVAQAISVAAEQVIAGRSSIVCHLPDGHAGVHGIAASRLVEKFGRPTVMLSPKPSKPGLLAGSCRTIPGVHMRDALQAVHDFDPTMMVAFGGHAGAAGLTLNADRVADFASALDAAVCVQTANARLHPFRFHDGPATLYELAGDGKDATLMDELYGLEPWGREFDFPTFQVEALVHDIKPMGDGTHMRLTLREGKTFMSAVWFSARSSIDEEIGVHVGDKLQFLVGLRENIYNDRRSLQVTIDGRPKSGLENNLVAAVSVGAENAEVSDDQAITINF